MFNHKISMRLFLFVCCMLAGSLVKAQDSGGYKIVWADEFNKDGAPDSSNWSYEKGFVRNEEDQWYQPEMLIVKMAF